MSVAGVIAIVLVVAVTAAASIVQVKGPDRTGADREPESRRVSRSFAGPADAGAEAMAVPRDGQVGPST